jgi:hypothetical protein
MFKGECKPMNSSVFSAQAAIEQIDDRRTLPWMDVYTAICQCGIWGLLPALLSFFNNGIL